MAFGKKKRVVVVGGQKIELEPKPSKGLFGFLKRQKAQPKPAEKKPQPAPAPVPEKKPAQKLGLFGKKPPAPKPAVAIPQAAPMPKIEIAKPTPAPQPAAKKPAPAPAPVPGVTPAPRPAAPLAPTRYTRLTRYAQKIAAKHPNLAGALRDQEIKSTVEGFVERMLIASILVAIVIALTVFLLLYTIVIPGTTTSAIVEDLVLAAVLGYASYKSLFNTFINYPAAKAKSTSKNIERDILFAARDLIISLRSGMPLYNAITAVSSGYGEASKEFTKIVDKVQLGMPLEEAIDDTISKTRSDSFRRLMLQASVSIKAGADVVSALQSIIDQMSQERIIELRAYGQKLNAIAMFYMLFGVILPSMGIAVVTILTTFIAVFTVDTSLLELVIVAIIVLQLIFLKIITGSRPVFSL